MNFTLEVTDYTQPVENFLDRLTFGGFILFLGMAIVFAVLISLWACLSIFKLYFGKIEKAPKTNMIKPMPVAEESTQADSEIVAVIAAAIATAESESNGIKFRVVSFKRK